MRFVGYLLLDLNTPRIKTIPTILSERKEPPIRGNLLWPSYGTLGLCKNVCSSLEVVIIVGCLPLLLEHRCLVFQFCQNLVNVNMHCGEIRFQHQLSEGISVRLLDNQISWSSSHIIITLQTSSKAVAAAFWSHGCFGAVYQALEPQDVSVPLAIKSPLVLCLREDSSKLVPTSGGCRSPTPTISTGSPSLQRHFSDWRRVILPEFTADAEWSKL